MKILSSDRFECSAGSLGSEFILAGSHRIEEEVGSRESLPVASRPPNLFLLHDRVSHTLVVPYRRPYRNEDIPWLRYFGGSGAPFDGDWGYLAEFRLAL